MNIIIAGMGVVGRHVAEILQAEHHNIILLDLDNDALESAADQIDAMTIKGHACSESTLRKADIESCDLFVAVTNKDEVNLIAALRAKHLGATKAIARATDNVYFEEERGLFENMFGVDLVINPKFLTAIELHKLIRTQGAVAVEDFANNQIEMVQLPIEPNASKIINRPIRDIRLPKNVLLAAIIRDGDIIVPRGEVDLRVGDEVLCIGRINAIPEVEKLFGRERTRFTRKAILVGGGQVGATLARLLEADGIRVTIIEQSRARCEELSEMLTPRTEILHGDGTNAALLGELGVDTSDVFVAVSPEDEINLMASILARELGARRRISLVHRPDYTHVLEALGLDTTLSPRLLVAKEVLKHVRTSNLVSVSPIMGGRGEFLEFIVPERARIVGRDLRDFPQGALVCAGFGETGEGDERRKVAFIPDGKTVIEVGQRIIVFTRPAARKNVERLFNPPHLLSL